VHGQATLEIGIEGLTGTIEFRAPGDDRYGSDTAEVGLDIIADKGTVLPQRPRRALSPRHPCTPEIDRS